MSSVLDLADYRRNVFSHYASVRANIDPNEAWLTWRNARDELFRSHPQTPLDPVDPDHVTPFFGYDPDFRVAVEVEAEEETPVDVSHSGQGVTAVRAFGVVDASLPTGSIRLTLYWLSGYAGGIFLPLRDGTAGRETYGGGRYLLDTVKGADLGVENGRLILDFNFAYHPSCVYSNRWSCPLAPQENHSAVPIPVGERLP